MSDFDDYDYDDDFFGVVPLPHTNTQTTALHEAFSFGDITRVDELLRNGVEVDVEDGQVRTPLQLAVRRGDRYEDIVRLLLQHGADITGKQGVHGNALAHAARGSPRIMELLLNHASAQQGFSLTSANRELHEAAEVGKVEMIRRLLDRGVSPNARGPMYGPALEAAAHYGSEESVQALIDAGADVNLQGGYLGNALQAAARDGHVNVVNILLRAGADVNASGGVEGNALAAATARDHPQVVEILLRAGALPVEGNQGHF